MKSHITFDQTLNKRRLLIIISPVTPYLAVALGLYVIGNGWVTFSLYHAGLISFILLAGHGRIFRDIFKGWNWTAAIISIACFSLAGPLLYLLWPIISIKPDALAGQLGAIGLDGPGRFVFVFIFLAVNPLMEEVYWRDFLISKTKGNEKLPWLVDILFALYHLPQLAFFIKPAWLIVMFTALYIAGYVWRSLTWKFGGVAVAIASHIAADLSVIIAIEMITH